MKVADIWRRARMIARTLGIRTAAGFCRNQGMSIEATMFILLGKDTRDYRNRYDHG